jgi:hypothetical protein
LGIDYSLNKNNTIGTFDDGNFILGGGLTRTKTGITDANSPIVKQILDAANDYYYQQTHRYNYNFNYKYEDASGNIINVDADYGTFLKNNKNLQSNIYTNNQNTVLNQNLYHTLNGIDINLKALNRIIPLTCGKANWKQALIIRISVQQMMLSFIMLLLIRIAWINAVLTRLTLPSKLPVLM